MSELAWARDAELPHQFAPGTPARARDVNENFAELQAAVSSKADRDAVEQSLVDLQVAIDEKADRDAVKPSMSASMGYSRASWIGVTLSNVRINGGAITAPVVGGSTVSFNVDYTVAACSGCLAQILVGFIDGGEVKCIYSGVANGGASGAASFTLTAPTQPGTYYLGFDRSLAFRCPGGWWSGGAWTPDKWFGAVTVI